ncbi:protodermal factor 1-like isoform X2 [Typha latifolia]|uniref:protodermal factor 1-like isoform X2 n=1 Tax=Typha latifolia TaxID=4733 RepID=UPI003C2B6018
MVSERSMKANPFICVVAVLGFVTMEVLSPVMARRSLEDFADKKAYYSPPDPHQHGHTPSTPSCTPTPSHGGAPSHGGGSTPAPSHGGGGYYNPPSSPIVTTPPVHPITPSPLVPTTPPTPFLPYIPTPPSTPTPFDPNFPPFFTGTCDFWRTHPSAIWALLGYWSTLGNFFGPVAVSTFGRNLSLQEALSNPRTDGFGALYREGTAALLNSMVNSRFAYTTQQVREAFTTAVGSNDAAAAQARLFKKANEGHMKH